ncbi:MAG: hypothetical protein WCK64_07150 [Synechococcaceae cyanobacterium ELA445]|jgi:hypothetical protein
MASDLRLGRRFRPLWTALLVGLSTALMATAHAATTPAAKAPATAPSMAAGLEAVSPSTPFQLALANHLRLSGAIFYGAWWCPHCFHQKNLFGTEGARKLPYVECDKDDQGRQQCIAAKVKAFPTWVLGGERREGLLSLEDLSTWSGFKGAGARSRP